MSTRSDALADRLEHGARDLALRLPGGGPVSGVTWNVVHELNAAQRWSCSMRSG